MSILQNLRVLEFAGLAPVPFCGMLLSDFGADVIRIDRVGDYAFASSAQDPLARGKKSIRLDLHQPEAQEIARKLVERADVLLDPYRPGVLERLGLGPEPMLGRNPRLIYARLTGYGQSGPLRDRAGHDINYVALSGALSLIGRAGEAPVPPVNLVADFGGGGMVAAFGVVLALLERMQSGRGQVLDIAMVDGASLLTTILHYWYASGLWTDRRGTNWFDTGAPWYEVYETADGKYMAVGAIEPQFFARLLLGLGIDSAEVGDSKDPAGWPKMRALFASRFKQKTQAQWCEVFDPTDACVSPVLGLREVKGHPHMAARSATFRSETGVEQPCSAPRFSRTPAEPKRSSPKVGEHTCEVLEQLGLSEEQIRQLQQRGVTM